MKNKVLYFIALFSFAAVLYSCREEIHVDFEYSPEMPRIGEQITFTNTSSAGDDFDWNFGNGTYSVFKSPLKTYTVPGTYAVTLRVDSNKNFVRTKYITVYDSVPTITRNVSTVNYFEKVTFSTLAYNPFSRTKTFQWFFSKNAVGDNLSDTIIVVEDGSMKELQVSHDESPVVFFNKFFSAENPEDEIVRLRMTIGDSIYSFNQIKNDTFQVKDVPTHSLLMTRKGKNMLRQRIFENGIEAVTETTVPSGKHPFNLISYGEQLFIFDAGTKIEENVNWESDTSGDGSIRVVNLQNDAVASVISNTGTSSYFGFYNGFVDDKYVYWSDRSDFLYYMDKKERDVVFEWKGNQQNTVPYYLVCVDSLGMEKNQYSGGGLVYDDTYFWGKGGAGKGLYRFTKEDIRKKELPQSSVILTDYAVRAFAIDKINAQLYFSAAAPAGKIGFWVANLDGTNIRSIEEAAIDDELEYITGIVVDNSSGNVFWAYRSPDDDDLSGVKQMKLANKYSKPKAEDIQYFNREKGVYGIALDKVLK